MPQTTPHQAWPAYEPPSNSKSMTVKQFRQCYKKGYKPPGWIEDSGVLKPYHWQSVKVYYDAADDRDKVRQLVQARDPVNIALDTGGTARPFSLPGAPPAKSYTQQFEANKTKLPPNIGVYCKTPMLVGGEVRDVHVYNAIAFGFDTPAQPDARFFCLPGTTRIDPAKRTLYKEHVRRIVQKILRCAADHNIQQIMLSMVGCESFAGENKATATDTFFEVLGQELREFDQRKFRIGMLGFDPDKERLEEACEDNHHTFKSFLYVKPVLIPDSIADCDKWGATMYVNAWDPHSAVGNGNGNDNSLDGYFGRASAMGPLCHPYTNRSLRGVSVYLPVADTSRMSATQPVFEGIERTFKERVIAKIPQPEKTICYYLSSGTSNPGHNFPDTFFPNRYCKIRNDGWVHKCEPSVSSWLTALVKRSCIGSSVILTPKLKDNKKSITIRSKKTTLKLSKPTKLCSIKDIKVDSNHRHFLGYGGEVHLKFQPKKPSSVLDEWQDKNGWYDIYDGDCKRCGIDDEYPSKMSMSFDAKDYYLSACDLLDIKMFNFLTKFCNWDDLQVASCLGGYWDIGKSGKNTLQNLKWFVQNYDFDKNTETFVERAVPLKSLGEKQKKILREDVAPQDKKNPEKKIILVRHGEGTHNASRNYDELDPSLTVKGQEQAKTLESQKSPVLAECQLLVVSPLSRAIESTRLIFPWANKWNRHDKDKGGRRVVLTPMHTEAYSGGCDVGSSKTVLLNKYPFIQNWEGIDELQEDWTHTSYDDDINWKTERLPAFLKWLKEQPESSIVVVGHSSFFKECLGWDHNMRTCEFVHLSAEQIERKLDQSAPNSVAKPASPASPAAKPASPNTPASPAAKPASPNTPASPAAKPASPNTPASPAHSACLKMRKKEMTDIVDFLSSINLAKYQKPLLDKYNSLEDIQNSTVDDLIEIGLKRPHAKQLLKKVHELYANPVQNATPVKKVTQKATPVTPVKKATRKATTPVRKATTVRKAATKKAPLVRKDIL